MEHCLKYRFRHLDPLILLLHAHRLHLLSTHTCFRVSFASVSMGSQLLYLMAFLEFLMFPGFWASIALLELQTLAFAKAGAL